MFRIDWGGLFLLLNPLVAPLLLLIFGVRRRRAWVRAAAQALGGQLRDRRHITGTTAGVPWELAFTYSLFPSRANWHLTFPSLTSTDLVLRAEKSSDQKWKNRGFITELTTGDEAFDRRHLLLCSDREAATRLLRHEPLRQAISVLSLEEGKVPQDATRKGSIAWVQAGRGLEAELDLHFVKDAQFPERLAALFQQVYTLAKTLQETPQRGTPGPLRPRVLDVNAASRVSMGVSLVALPVGLSFLGALTVLTGNTDFPLGLFTSWIGGMVLGLLVGLGWLGASRGQFAFHRRAWQVPCFALLASVLLPTLLASLNALPSETPIEERQVKVLASFPEGLGGIEYWELELEGIGKVGLPYDFGQAIPRDSKVQVRVTTGRLGITRVLGVTPLSAPAEAGNSAP